MRSSARTHSKQMTSFGFIPSENQNKSDFFVLLKNNHMSFNVSNFSKNKS